MKLKVNFKIFDLDGKALEHNANRYIASILMDKNLPNDTMKLFLLGQKINKAESVDIDMADLKLVEDTVKTSTYSNLIKGAILVEIENQKVLSKKKD